MKTKIIKKNAGFFIVIISIMLLTPTITVIANQNERQLNSYNHIFDDNQNTNTLDITKTIDNTRYIPIEEVSMAGEQNDIGYNVDAGNSIVRSIPVYVGEPVDQTIPGRGRTGALDPGDNDDADWYLFSVCQGQTITASVSSTEDYDFELSNSVGEPVGHSYTADATGTYFINIFANENSDAADYTFNVILGGQNDAETGSDAGDDMNQATPINAGFYYGYLDYLDHEDWFSFNVNSGQGIFVTVEPMENSDYDIHLYNPNGELVHSEQIYGDDELEYPADISGIWKIKIDIFPGWDENLWPEDYFLYGSGVYELELEIGGTAEAPPTLKPQTKNIIPVAQTFVINDDPDSTKDEYCYLAAVPAATYIENGQRHVSPIIYQGVDTIPNWFTSIDQTTQYLLDDWNEYLDNHGLTAEMFEISENPVQASAELALEKWTNSDTAVIAIDGSGFTDQSNDIFDDDFSLSSTKETDSFGPADLKEITEEIFSSPMYIGSKWGAVHVIAEGEEFDGDTLVMTPRYESLMGDWWPHDSGAPGEDKDTFFPIALPGIWFPQVTSIDGLESLNVVKYSGNRHKLNVGDNYGTLQVTISTQEPSNLIIYLIDPDGNVRRPSYPHWNGGDIKPLHQWNGGHWEHDEDEYRHMIIEPHTEYTVEVNNPTQGNWVALVVPYIDMDTWEASFDGTYNIKATFLEHNPNRIAAGLSAANAAVLASLNHAPLLYVTADSVPSETSNAINSLGVSNIIFINIDEVSAATPSGSVTEYTTMNEVVSAIKDNSVSENVITITSFATGDGYFAPSGLIAAFHGSPVLNIAQAKEAYNAIDVYQSWREYAGDYYHGCRALGHLPMMNEPIDIGYPPSLIELILYYFRNDKTLPPVGLDYKMHLLTTVVNNIYSIVDGYGLNNNGQEAYIFVSPRDNDIRDSIARALNGNNSYAGLIPVETTAFSSAIICRNILYPALIHVNPGKDVTTSQHMNYYGGQFDHTGNDGVSYNVYAPTTNKHSFSSYGRFYEGHCMWHNLLERYNTGTLISLYSGHGTGGSGISSQYKNIAEQFPLAQPRHESLYDFDWWDSWAGYSGYDNPQTKTIRDGGNSIYNAEEPSLYDIIHFKWVDQLFDNLHSQIEIWSSCTTASHFGPFVYLSHGTVAYAGCLGSGYTLVDDLYKSWILRDMLIKGYTIGEAFSLNHWKVNRDFTTGDPTSIYGEASFFADGISSNNAIFGDPTLQCYNPTWIEPVPITP